MVVSNTSRQNVLASAAGGSGAWQSEESAIGASGSLDLENLIIEPPDQLPNETYKHHGVYRIRAIANWEQIPQKISPQ
jgi:hypothetical protein